MKIVLISDTHTQHRKILIPPCDILIHGGDFTYSGEAKDVIDFNDWLGNIPAKHKVVIAGNHELTFDQNKNQYDASIPPILTNCIYLNDSGCEVEGLKIWGSPITPWFMDWAFNRMRGEEIAEHWKLIPTDTDILITHGPPFNILDKPFGSQPPVGCVDLLTTVQVIKPKLHVFGHIHQFNWSSYILRVDTTTYVNASSVDESYKLKTTPLREVCTKCWNRAIGYECLACETW